MKETSRWRLLAGVPLWEDRSQKAFVSWANGRTFSQPFRYF
jgi:hypothetical protein